MVHLRSLVALAALTLIPCLAFADSMAASPSMGAGPTGYDFLIGTWTCTSSAATAMGGPSTSTLTASRAQAGGAIYIRSTGKGFDEAGYAVYSPKSKTWWNPNAFADGGYSTESSTQSGKKTVWTGVYVTASGKTIHIRDTYMLSSMTKFTDLDEIQAGGAWKAQYTITCTKH